MDPRPNKELKKNFNITHRNKSHLVYSLVLLLIVDFVRVEHFLRKKHISLFFFALLSRILV